MKGSIKRIYAKWKPVVVDGWLLQGYRWRMPDDIIIEPTNICSLQCRCCPNGVADAAKRPHGTMDAATFRQVLANIDIKVSRCYLHLCGEPFLCSSLPEYVGALNRRGITAVIFSNGYRIDKALLREVLAHKRLQISFSADIISAEQYEKLRYPAKYDVMTRELEEIDSIFAESNRFYGLNVIIGPDIAETVADRCLELFRRFKRLNSISLNSQWPWPGLSELGDLPGHLTPTPRLCSQAKSALAILWNGDVAFCASDWSGDTVVGNILDHKYSRLFNGRRARHFRKHLFMRSVKGMPMCSRCIFPRYESLVVMLHRNKFAKATAEGRNDMLAPLFSYYDLWKSNTNQA